MTRTNTTLAMLSIFAVSALASQVQADEYQHINGLARQIQQKSSALHREMIHYRHTPQYRHIKSDTHAMKRLAREIQRIARAEGCLIRLQDGLDELRDLYNHIGGFIGHIELNAAYGHGHIHGDTCHVKVIMDDLDRCIRHMQQDVAILRARARRAYVRPVYSRPIYVPQVAVPSRPAYVPYGYTRCPNTGRLIRTSGYRGYDFSDNYRGGFTIGKGAFRVHFDF